MNELAQIPVESALAWGVCARFGSEDLLRATTGGRPTVNALEMMELPIRPVDKLWLVMRLPVLPLVVLGGATMRMTGDLPVGYLTHPRGREAVLEAVKRGDYFGASRHINACQKELNGRSSEDVAERQLAILKEEIHVWLASPS